MSRALGPESAIASYMRTRPNESLTGDLRSTAVDLSGNDWRLNDSISRIQVGGQIDDLAKKNDDLKFLIVVGQPYPF